MKMGLIGCPKISVSKVKELVSQVHVQCDAMHLLLKCILHIRAVMGLQLMPGVARVDFCDCKHWSQYVHKKISYNVDVK